MIRKLCVVLSLCALAIAQEERYTPTLNSITTGYVSPLIEARTDYEKYPSACRTLENMFVTAQGPISRRPGTKYIAEVKDFNDRTRLIPFQFSTEDVYVLELGNEYMRFYRNGGQILSSEGTEDYSALNNIVAHWLINDNQGQTDVIDDEGNHNGTASANTDILYDSAGLNGCFDLAGQYSVVVSDHADWSFTDDSNDTSFSLTAWIYVTDTASQQTIISKWKQDTAREWRFYLDSSEKLCLDLHDDSSNLFSNLIAQYKCNDNAASTVVLEETLDHNGVASANTSGLSIAGKISTAFNMANTHAIDVPDDDELSFTIAGQDQPFSVSAWVYASDESGEIISKYSLIGTDAREWRFLISDNGKLYVYLRDESTSAYIRSYSTDIVPLHTFNHLVFTYDGSESSSGLNLYINNELVDQTRDAWGLYYGMENTDANMVLGGYYSYTGSITNFLSGYLDNIMIFDVELSSSQIAGLYNNNIGVEDLSAGTCLVQRISDNSLSEGWRFVASTYSAPSDETTAADGITFYVDGSEIDSTAYNNSEYTAMQGSAIDVKIGAELDSSDANQYFWADKIDNIAVFSDVLSSSEITTLANLSAYEIETPFDEEEIWDIKYAQADNTMYLVDGNDRPQVLTRTAHTSWILEDAEITTGPFLPENTDTSITITPPDAASDITTADSAAISSGSVFGKIPQEAFDDDIGNDQRWEDDYSGAEWVGQNFGGGKIIKRIKIWPCGNTSEPTLGPKYLRIEASNDGTNYTKISINKWYGRCEGYNGDEAYVDYIITLTEYIELYLDNDDAYQYWRIYITENWGSADYVHILEIEMFEADTGLYIASDEIFNEGHAGSIWQINQDRETSIITGTFTAAGISETSVYFTGSYSFTTESSSWDGTLALQRSTNYGATWRNALSPLTDTNFDNAETEEDGAIYRVKATDVGGGSITYNLTIADQANHGVIRIDSYASPNSVTGTVISPLYDDSATIQWREGYFSDYRGWPRTAALHQQRLIFGGSKNFAQTLWFGATNPGNYLDFTEGALDDDAFTIGLPGQNPIRWMASRDYLVIGTTGSVGKYGDQGEPITPTSPSYQEQTNTGSANLTAVLAQDALLYVERGGEKIREFVYSLQYDKYLSPDLTVLAEDILESGVVDISFQFRPEPILWCVLDDGNIATMTYQREQEIFGWAKHTTDGDFESVCCVPGSGSEDEVWVTVERTIDSNTVRYIEQFQPRDWGDDINDCWFVDCALDYDGTDANSFTGFNHLIGEDVYILGDGVIEPNEVVDATGGIIIDRAAGRVTAGLPFTSKFETLPIFVDPQDKPHNKKITNLYFDFFETGYCKYGAGSDATLVNINFENDMNIDPNYTAQPLYTSEYNLKKCRYPFGSLTKHTIYCESEAPLPLTIRSITYDLRIYPKE